MSTDKIRECIEACIRCAHACEHCAQSCLSESDVTPMAACIRIDRDCAEMCWSAAAFMSRGSLFIEDVCDVCAKICDACAAECGKHDMEHCQKCAEACQRCAQECRAMVGVHA